MQEFKEKIMEEYERFDASDSFDSEEYYVDMTMMETIEFLNRYGVDFFIKRLPDSLKDDLYHALERERNAFPE